MIVELRYYALCGKQLEHYTNPVLILKKNPHRVGLEYLLCMKRTATLS